MPQYPPAWPFTLNKDSPQAQGLVFWAPFGRVQGDEYDIIQGRQLTNNNSILHVSSPRMQLVPSFNGTNQLYTAAMPEVYEEPLGLFCRVFPNSIAATGYPLTCGNGGTSSGFYGIAMSGATGGDPATAQKQSTGGVSGTANTTTSYVASVWQAVMASFDTTTSRTIWLDGLNGQATNTTSVAASSPDWFAVGGLQRSGASNWFSGLVADARVYNRSLSDVDMVLMTDPRTAFDLWYPLRRKVWSFGRPAAGAARQQTLSVLGVGA